MKTKLTNCGLLSAAVLAITPIAHSALVITPGLSANQLADLILGSGITRVGDAVYTGDPLSSGGFTGGNSVTGPTSFGMNSGILLTTGFAATAASATNTSDSATTGGAITSSRLSFDFTSDGGNLFFNYIFASEEYNEFVNSQFNDLFTLRLDGVNLALIPGTSQEVTINNVNLVNNSAFFRSNDPSDDGDPTPYGFEYDGFTTLLTAQALGLAPGLHTIEFFITDVGDSQLDSAVFIQGGSFSDAPPSPITVIPEPSSTLGLGLLIATGLLTGRNRRK